MKTLQTAVVCVALLWTSIATAAPVPGRIAISSDGNKHDCDDLFATAVTVAIIAKSGNASKLRYYGHSDHIWATSGGCRGDNRETEMQRSARDTAEMWGGFDLDVFINAKQDTSEAVQRLTALINASSANDPLWIIAAGPMEVVGRAIAASEGSKRQYVTVISHSTWNDEHSDKASSGESPSHSGWTWDEIGRMSPSVVRKHIADQNSGLHTTYSTYHSWRDSSDAKMRWLWARSQVTGIDWPDCSDAGMAYWLVQGRGSDDRLSPSELKSFFAASTPEPEPEPSEHPAPKLLEAEPVVP
jgi:hypothetical protein